jgi:hypothetical protein
MSSSTSGSTNVVEESGEDGEDDIIRFGDFIGAGEDVLGMPDLWHEPVVTSREGMEEMDGDEEDEDEDEDEQERVDEERIVSRFMTRHGWAWENEIDHHLRPV